MYLGIKETKQKNSEVLIKVTVSLGTEINDKDLTSLTFGDLNNGKFKKPLIEDNKSTMKSHI